MQQRTWQFSSFALVWVPQPILDNTMAITLYGAHISPFVRKVRAALAYKGLPYDIVFVAPNQTHAAIRGGRGPRLERARAS